MISAIVVLISTMFMMLQYNQLLVDNTKLSPITVFTRHIFNILSFMAYIGVLLVLRIGSVEVFVIGIVMALCLYLMRLVEKALAARSESD